MARRTSVSFSSLAAFLLLGSLTPILCATAEAVQRGDARYLGLAAEGGLSRFGFMGLEMQVLPTAPLGFHGGMGVSTSGPVVALGLNSTVASWECLLLKYCRSSLQFGATNSWILGAEVTSTNDDDDDGDEAKTKRTYRTSDGNFVSVHAALTDNFFRVFQSRLILGYRHSTSAVEIQETHPTEATRDTKTEREITSFSNYSGPLVAVGFGLML